MKTLMNGVSKKSESIRILILLLLCLVPLYLIINGIIRLANGWLLNSSIVIIYFLLPLICMLSLFVIIRKIKLYIAVKVVLCILIYALFLCLIFYCSFFAVFNHLTSYSGDDALTKYNEKYYEVRGLPLISEFGDFSEIEYHVFDSDMALAEPRADLIICKYDNEHYEYEKEKALAKYIFQDEPKVIVNGYEFRMLSVEKYFDYFPKDVGFIGISDISKEIAFIHYEDVELDYIFSTYEFILDDCGFQYVR